MDRQDTRLATLSIIGTAGRGDDFARLDTAVYDRMTGVARAIIGSVGVDGLVSGGAAWADHVAVRLALEGVVPANRLTLHLPAPFAGRAFDEATRDGSTANHYHRRFAQRIGIDTLGQIAKVVAMGAQTTVSAGFKARNLLVAGSEGVLAFTFGSTEAWRPMIGGPDTNAADAGLKDGGTAHTFGASRSRVKIHVSLG